MDGYWVIVIGMVCITVAVIAWRICEAAGRAGESRNEMFKNGYYQEPYEANDVDSYGEAYTETRLRWVKPKE